MISFEWISPSVARWSITIDFAIHLCATTGAQLRRIGNAIILPASSILGPTRRKRVS